jgi:hypothetical protein
MSTPAFGLKLLAFFSAEAVFRVGGLQTEDISFCDSTRVFRI